MQAYLQKGKHISVSIQKNKVRKGVTKMKKKPSKLLASITAAAMAVMCAVVAVPEVEVSAADEPKVSVTWTNTDNVYNAVAEAKPADAAADDWGGSGTTGEVDYTALVPADVSLADITGVNVKFTVDGSANGKVGGNINTADGTPDYGSWSSVSWGDKNPLDVTLDTPYGLSEKNGKLQLQLNWVNYGTKVSATVTLTDKEGNTYPSGGTTPEEPVDPTPSPAEDSWQKNATEGTFTYKLHSYTEADGVDKDGKPNTGKVVDEINIPFADLGISDLSKVTSVSADITASDFANGCVGLNDLAIESDSKWKQEGYESKKGSKTTCTVTASGTDSKDIKIQFWWVNFGTTVTVSNITAVADGKTYKYGTGSTPDPKPEDKVEVEDPANTTDTTVAADKSAIEAAVTLTDAEKTSGVTLSLKVDNATLDTTATEEVSKAAADKGLTVSNTVLDIKLVKTVTGGTASDVTTLAKPLPITVDVPAALINNDSTKTREYFVIHYHGNKADIIGGTFANGKFTFSVDGFSAFVLAYKDTPKATEPSGDAIWEGSQDIASWSDNLQIPADKFSAIKGGDKISITYAELGGGEAQLKIVANFGNWDGLASTNPNEWGCAPISGSPYTFTLSDGDAALLKEHGMALSGQNIKITKVDTTSGGSTPVDPVDPVDPKPETKPTYSVTVSGGYAVVTGDRTAGSEMTVSMPIGFVARVYNGSTLIATIWDGGKFTMPAGSVYINVSDESGAGMMAYTAPNSYIFTYKSDMTLIKTTRSKKGISGTGEMTVKLGAEYAGKTVTLYSGKKSTANKITEAELDSKGCATFTVEGAKNYTLVVED